MFIRSHMGPSIGFLNPLPTELSEAITGTVKKPLDAQLQIGPRLHGDGEEQSRCVAPSSKRATAVNLIEASNRMNEPSTSFSNVIAWSG
uniref:Uncharacterized protein n=1 Tax=Arundo donax TaxID=35708 RepID=A0A0A9DW79_ARUDO